MPIVFEGFDTLRHHLKGAIDANLPMSLREPTLTTMADVMPLTQPSSPKEQVAALPSQSSSTSQPSEYKAIVRSKPEARRWGVVSPPAFRTAHGQLARQPAAGHGRRSFIRRYQDRGF